MLWQCCAKDLVGFSLRNILVRERLWFGCRDHGLVSMKPKLTVIRLQEIISDIQCYSQTFCFWPFQPPWCRLCGSIMMSSSFLFHDPQTRLIIHTRWLSSWNINIFCFGAFSETTNAVVSLGRTVSKEKFASAQNMVDGRGEDEPQSNWIKQNHWLKHLVCYWS